MSPYPPGGPNDIVARLVAQRMSLAFGQQWIVDNRPGRGGNIGTDLVAKSAPDGYTLVHGGMGSLTLGPFLTIVRLNAEITRFLRTPEAASLLAAQGADVAYSSPEDLLALIKSDLDKWGKVIRDNGIRGE